MTKPVRIRLSRAKNWRLQLASHSINGLDAVKVDRTTKYGNPFRVGEDGTRADCVYMFTLLMGGLLAISKSPECVQRQETFRRTINAELHHLRGKNLACWCSLPAPGEPDCCHAAVLLEAANA